MMENNINDIFKDLAVEVSSLKNEVRSLSINLYENRKDFQRSTGQNILNKLDILVHDLDDLRCFFSEKIGSFDKERKATAVIISKKIDYLEDMFYRALYSNSKEKK